MTGPFDLDRDAARPADACVYVASDRRDEAARVARAIGGAEASRRPVAARGGLAALAALPLDAPGALVAAALCEFPTPRLKLELARLARRTALIVVADAAALDAIAEFEGGRAIGLLERGTLSLAGFEAVARTLLGARRVERRLLGALAAANQRLSQAREAARDLRHGVAQIAEAHKTASARPNQAAATTVDHALADLGEAQARLERAASGAAVEAPTRGEAADLNAAVEAVAREARHSGPAGLSVLTSAEPIALDVDHASVIAMLRAVARAWRMSSRSGEALEFFTWDAGVEARLAVVIHGTKSEGTPDAAAEIARAILAACRFEVEGCRASAVVEPGPAGRPDKAFLSFGLPKRTGLTIGFARAPDSPAARRASNRPAALSS